MTADGYCQAANVRYISSLTTSDISDIALEDIIENVAMPLVNHDISVFVYREKVVEIDNTKTNDIDGVNKTYYTQEYPLCDMDNDGGITATDLLAYTVAPDGTESSASLSSIVGNTGKFVLSTAPAGGYSLEITYRYMKNRDILTDTPHPLLVLACAQLTAAYAHTKLDSTAAGKLVKFRVDNFSADIQPMFDHFMKLYRRTIEQITSNAASKGHGVLI